MKRSMRLFRRFFRIGLRHEVRDVVSIETSALAERLDRVERDLTALAVEFEDALTQLRAALRSQDAGAQDS